MKPWLQALSQALRAGGPAGVINPVLIVALACVVLETPAAAIYAIAVLLMAAAFLTIAAVVVFRFSKTADTGEKPED
ncbi:hypothetical protein ACWEVP_15195 [Amycolatopsis sp. NPDC003865]